MTTDTKLTAAERAEAELEEELRFVGPELEAEGVELTEAQSRWLEAKTRQITRLAQNVVLARLKARAYEVSESHRNSGGGEAIDAENDAWDDAVHVADPSEYEVSWMRSYTP